MPIVAAAAETRQYRITTACYTNPNQGKCIIPRNCAQQVDFCGTTIFLLALTIKKLKTTQLPIKTTHILAGRLLVLVVEHFGRFRLVFVALLHAILPVCHTVCHPGKGYS